MAKFGSRIADAAAVPTDDFIGRGAWRATTRAGIWMDAADVEEDEDEATGEGRRVEEEDDEQSVKGRPALFIRRRHAGATPPSRKFASWAMYPQLQPAETVDPDFVYP